MTQRQAISLRARSSSGGCSASPDLSHCLPLQEGLSFLVSVPRSRRKALWQEVGGASGAQLQEKQK